MAILGIIAEFNPFHNGHKYLFDTVKTADDTLVCVMSGNYVQRGDTAIYPKSIRAEAAILNGADLIAELPTPYAMSSASNFAYGAVSILKQLGVDTLCFGSESDDIASLIKISEISQSEKFNKKVLDFLSKGITYSAAFEKALRVENEKYGIIIKNPNDVLAVEYITACKKLNFSPEFKSVKRRGVNHNSETSADNFASASAIREKIYNEKFAEIEKFVPSNTLRLYTENYSTIDNLDRVIPALLRTKPSDCFSALPDISEGIENRLIKAIKQCGTYTDICTAVKTKRYTLARVRRLVLHAALNTKDEYLYKFPAYLRILGFSKKGENLIKRASKTSEIPIILRASDIEKHKGNAEKLFNYESIATDIYSLSLKKPLPSFGEATGNLIKK